MAIDHDGDIQCAAEIVEDDGSSSCVGGTITATHTARLVQQKTNRQCRCFVGQCVLTEHAPIQPRNGVCVQPTPHEQGSLLTATPAVLQLLCHRLLKLAGDVQQIIGDLVILVAQLRLHLADAVYRHIDTVVDVPVGDALGKFVQLTLSLFFQTGVDSILSNCFQDPGNVRCGIGIAGTTVGIVMLCSTALRYRQGVRLPLGQPPLLGIRHSLTVARLLVITAAGRQLVTKTAGAI